MLSQILSVRSCVVLCFLNLLLTSAFASHIARPLHRSQVLARNHVRHRASPEETSQLQTENLRLRGEYSEKLAERERMLQGLSSEKNPLSIRDETSLSRRQDVTMTGQISALQAENQKLQGMIADLELLINDLVQFIGSKYGQAATIASVPSAAGSTPVNSQSVLATQAPVGQGGSAQGAEPTNSPVVVASTPAPGQQSQGTPQQGQSYAPTAVVPLTSLLSNLSTVPSLSAIPTSSSSSSSIAQTQSSASLTNDSVASSGSFDPMSSRNIAVYYGQTPVTSQVSLSTVCQDVSIDIVVLAFVNNLFSGGGYPSVNFGPYCNNGPTAAQSAAGATGLLDCSDLASQITTCQGLGKKVLLSLGGAISTSSIPDAASAQSLATNLWNLFAGGTSDLRPFGNSVSVDGFDIDNEDHSTANYPTFISELRSYFKGADKPYFMSAAPQCPRPDASIPLSSMQNDIDFTWVQFYDNTPCNIGTDGFIDSVQAWSEDLANGSFNSVGNGVSSPRLYIGGFSYSPGYGSGYLPIDQFNAQIQKVKQLNLPNFGGVMLWDGAEGVLDTANGENFIDSVKLIL